MRTALALVAMCLALAGCGGAAATTSPLASAVASAASSAATDETSNGTVSAPVPTASASGSDTATLAPESVAEVVTDDLRVRTAPSVDKTSVVLEPLLDRGTKLLVLDGPVDASGYPWYHVMTFESILGLPGVQPETGARDHGWVAATDKDGTAWVAPAKVDCPAVPQDVDDLIALDDVTAFACFAGDPITLRARVLVCGDSPEITVEEHCGPATGDADFVPAWFGRTDEFLVNADGPIDQNAMLGNCMLTRSARSPSQSPLRCR